MGMKGKFENIKSRINKQAATDEAFVQFCNNEVNLRRLRHMNWWFVNESDFPNNNVILMLLQKAFSRPRQWQLEALCTYIGQLAARSSEEERSDLEQQEIFQAAKEQYPNEFAMGEAYIYENPGSNGEATLAQAKDSIFFDLKV